MAPGQGLLLSVVKRIIRLKPVAGRVQDIFRLAIVSYCPVVAQSVSIPVTPLLEPG